MRAAAWVAIAIAAFTLLFALQLAARTRDPMILVFGALVSGPALVLGILLRRGPPG